MIPKESWIRDSAPVWYGDEGRKHNTWEDFIVAIQRDAWEAGWEKGAADMQTEATNKLEERIKQAHDVAMGVEYLGAWQLVRNLDIPTPPFPGDKP